MLEKGEESSEFNISVLYDKAILMTLDIRFT